MANHHPVASTDTSSNNYLTEAVDPIVYLPACIKEEQAKTQLTSIAYSIRHHLQVMQTSAAKICHDVYRAKLIFGKSGHEDFVAFALANFFPRTANGGIVDNESNRRRIRLWAQNGKLIDEYFQKQGGDFGRFKKLTMAALTSLSGAPEDIVVQALENPGDVVAADVNAQVALRRSAGEAASVELEFVGRQIESTSSNALERAEAIAEDLRQRLRIMQESSINRDREIEESARELDDARRQLEEARDELRKATASQKKGAINTAAEAVERGERTERALSGKLEAMKRQSEELQRRLDNMTQQLQSSSSVISTLTQLRDDVAVLSAKYPAALIAKLNASDKRVRPILAQIASGLHAMAQQIEVAA